MHVSNNQIGTFREKSGGDRWVKLERNGCCYFVSFLMRSHFHSIRMGGISLRSVFVFPRIVCLLWAPHAIIRDPSAEEPKHEAQPLLSSSLLSNIERVGRCTYTTHESCVEYIHAEPISHIFRELLAFFS